MTEETFTRRRDFVLAEYWDDQLAEFDRTRFSAVARLRIAPTLVARLPDVGDAALLRAVADAHLDQAGWAVVDYPIESPGWAATQLVRYGGDIEVLAPEAVRTELRRLARAVLDRLGGA